MPLDTDRCFVYSSLSMAIVSAEMLEPPVAYGRGFDPHETALLLDGYLRRLASQESRCRLTLGALAATFLRRSGHHQLGFARLGDWARERLGRSSREVQSLASVHTRLETLPRLRAAFLAGRLSWAQTRLLVGIASADSEKHWLALAEHRTVRALEATIRESRTAPAADDEELRAEFRLRCPRRILLLWRETVELARRMAGAQLTQGDAAEAIAAEAVSARPPSDEVWPAATTPPTPVADPVETRDVFPVELDWSAVAEAVPDDVEPLSRDIDTCDAFTLEARMRVVVRALQRIDWQTGRLLRVFLDRRLYWLMQFPSAARYLRERLGMSARKARALVALERRTLDDTGARRGVPRGRAVVGPGDDDPTRPDGTNRSGVDHSRERGHGAAARRRGRVGARRAERRHIHRAPAGRRRPRHRRAENVCAARLGISGC